VDREGTVRTGEFNFVHTKRSEIHQLGTRVYVHHRILSALKIVEYVRDRLSYIDLSGRLCNIIVLNEYAQREGKSDGSKDTSMRNYIMFFIIFLRTKL